MHPSIRQFPSDQFYNGALRDCKEILSREKECQDLPKVNLLSKYYKRVVFFDLLYSAESDNNLSKRNDAESDFTFKLIQ